MGKMKNSINTINYKKIGIGLGSGILGSIILFFIVLTIQTSPISNENQEVEFTVSQGETYTQILNNLQNEGVIKSAFFTRIKTSFGNKIVISEGTYQLNKSWSSNDIINTLKNNSNIQKEFVIRLNEGGWAKDYAAILTEYYDYTDEEILSVWNDKDYIQSISSEYSVLKSIDLDNKEIRVLLEGFLYPDTYYFERNASIEDITEQILTNTQSKFETVFSNNDSQFNNYELVTLSSIVQYEAGSMDDMKKVAGVFVNRLAIDMRLQSSVTVCYALYEFEDWKDCESKKPDNLYNTYLYKGLTPGPILNPTVDALQAVLNYDNNDYYYFIADVYGDGTIYYQKTYEEHEKVRLELLGY